ncbi:MAG: nicotinate-nucleotide--dimethylbenzimidazole phosphoribosyltransferase [Ktedonobacter sp. 13_1_20CM_3_54_15]|nr:MAG: nicotinate-nucleotide--dimethylbenzimidazole phosphoribosyltransferase [Ktedonobacter sp. 13_2_20CM_53_11]OLE01762.1 MAG: nicotinate-nucleotide--dimethylbenzimidazole phosphoribosyltransferase [Ktedonobacter sp. 13_1_20CM_4_53_11]OLE32705.1 MAG: nicotinate-nucleotide--dimethylbenzimidazole phosphoribosyltransferase [Ktedonobacter sp. 13_1_20CM_3_54_15]
MQHIRDRAISVEPLDTAAMELASARQQQLTKPAGSLGRLEDIAVQIAGITGHPVPRIERKAVIIMAGDHGVTNEGVSAYPSAVTLQMVYNFLQGGAAINALAHFVGAKVIVVDVGVAADISHPDLLSRKVAFGTADMALEPAMTHVQMLEAIQVGIDIFDAQLDQGIDLVATGDMGIGNTTAASAITASLLQMPVALVTGRGTGIDDEQLAHKIQVIEKALARHVPNPQDPLDVLMKVGGLEIAGLVGVIVAAASRRVPVVIDGFISGAAALIAIELNPLVREYLLAGHVSVERGHHLILERLGLSPLLDLKLRLGEGTGAVLAMSLIEAALHTHSEMATFEEAGVSTREEK